MKRIPLKKEIKLIIESCCICSDPIGTASIMIAKMVSNGYRRREYKQKGYHCNTCNKSHKPEQLCPNKHKKGI